MVVEASVVVVEDVVASAEVAVVSAVALASVSLYIIYQQIFN